MNPVGRTNPGDRWLLVLPLILAAIGLVMVYSSSAILGLTRYQDAHHFFGRHLVRVLLGVAVLLACARVRLDRIERCAPWLLGGAVALLATLEVVGQVSNGASRWLRLGFFSLQPTDVARLATVAFLAWWFKRWPPAEHGFPRGMLVPLAVTGVVSALILLQPNLSSAALLACTGLLTAFLAGAPLRHLAIPVAAGTGAGILALAAHPYMMERLRTFAGTWLSGAVSDARGAGWQLDQSLIAIGSGGWWGRGIGGGLQKYLFLPEAHTDFIFSNVAEETGFLGATALLALITLFLWRGMRAAARAADPFASLLAAGLTAQIALYALVNLGVATGLVPTTGLPLPFVSYGGSALLANMAAAGLLYRVSAERDVPLAGRRWRSAA